MGLCLAAAIEVRRTKQLVLPTRVGAFQNCKLKPLHGLREVTSFEVRRTGADEGVELQRIIWSQTERDRQPLKGSFGMPLANLDQATAGPGPRGTPADGKSFARGEIRLLDLIQQGECVAENRKDRRVSIDRGETSSKA